MHLDSERVAREGQRLDWIDAIKGVSIILVVLFHATYYAQPYDWYGALPDDIMSAMRSMRMPLFFMASGYFFLRRVDRPWAWWGKNRIAPFVYLFVVWSVVWALVSSLGWQRMAPTDDFLDILIDPNAGPWFILALALYFVGMKVLRPLPVWAQFAVGAAVSIPAAVGLVSVTPGWDNILTYFIVFQFGAHGHRAINWLVANATILSVLAAGVAWAGFSAIMLLQGGVFESPWRIPVTAAGVALGVTGATLVQRWAPWLGLATIGTRTLPIYLLHIPIIGLVYGFGPSWPTGNIFIQFGVPLCAAAVAIAVSIALEAPLRKVPGIFMAPWRGEGPQTLPVKRDPVTAQGT